MAPRLITASLALAGAAAFGTISTVVATDTTSVASAAGRSGWEIPGLLSLASLALLALALAFRDGRPVMLAIALLGAAWLVGTPDSAAWRTLTAVAGGWLLGVAELAYWSLDFKVAGSDPPAIYRRRGARITALIAASTILALVPLLDLSGFPVGGLELTTAGLLAAAALIAVAAAMAWGLRAAR